MLIYCCECARDVDARLTDGAEIYPHRDDLYDLPFWRCDTCENYVGCHHKTQERTRPLGVIPNDELRNARKSIHRILDPLAHGQAGRRREIYAKLSAALGYPYHTAELRTIEEARKVECLVRELIREAG